MLMYNDTFMSESINCGSIIETIGEGMHMVLSEASSFYEHLDGTDLILTEYANNPNYQILQESILTSTKDLVIKFLKRCEVVSRNIVDRLKEFASKLTLRTNDWIRVIQPRVEAAKKRSGWESIKADVFPWDPRYLESGISDGIGKLHKNWTSLMSNTTSMVSRDLNNTVRTAVQRVGLTGSTGSIDPAIDRCESLAEEFNNRIDEFEDTLPMMAGSAFGVPGANSMDDVWEQVAIKAHGGSREPGYTFGRDIDRIMATTINASSLVNKVKAIYEEHAKALKDHADKIKAYMDELDAAYRDYTVSELANASIAALKMIGRYTVRVTESTETVMARANALNVSMIQQMVADYMRCVNMFITYKGPGTVER